MDASHDKPIYKPSKCTYRRLARIMRHAEQYNKAVLALANAVKDDKLRNLQIAPTKPSGFGTLIMAPYIFQSFINREKEKAQCINTVKVVKGQSGQAMYDLSLFDQKQPQSTAKK